MRRRGYTLVEVLVACGVVSLLAGLLFSVLSRANGQAQTAACVSRLHQLWLGYRLAALDRDCRVQDLIAEDTYPYTEGERLWRCVTGTELDRRYTLRLPVPDPAPGDTPFLGDPYHAGRWLWVTLDGSVRVSPCRKDNTPCEP